MNDDNNIPPASGKIIWKRSVDEPERDDATAKESRDGITSEDTDPVDIPKNPLNEFSHTPSSAPADGAESHAYMNEKVSPLPEDAKGVSLEDIKSEIEAALSGTPSASSAPTSTSTSPQESVPQTLSALREEPLGSRGEKLSPINETAANNHEVLTQSLRESIDQDFESQGTSPELPEPDTSGKGIDQTYHKDVSTAMGSNEPRTMSELIRKSRFEEKEAQVLSPRSKKNIAFIIGAIILLLGAIIILVTLFRGGTKVEFITDATVSSLVSADTHTGINVTGLESARIKQAIREVIEKKIPDESVHQIYYVEEDGVGNARRLGIKDIFNKTDNTTPTLLYDNIENTFTHGVYRSDKNYPFIIIKSLSYDRSFQGLLEWEPTMIDDLATYLDLPPEATDRSLRSGGFEDDLINNKNVRIARYFPREVDRRGILDFFGGGNNDQAGQPVPEAPLPEGEAEESELPQGGLGRLSHQLFAWSYQPAFAQTEPVVPAGQGTGSSFENFAQGGTGPTTRVCYNNAFPAQTFDASLEGQPGYYCVNVLGGGTALGGLATTDDICFDPITGDRLIPEETPVGTVNDPYGLCFASYRCNRVACYRNGQEVNSSMEGQPGVDCNYETNERVPYDYVGDKMCYQYTDLLRMGNINSSLLCFNEQGQYLPSYTQGNGSSDGVTCIDPMSRQGRLCVLASGEIVIPVDEGVPAGGFCFEPLDGRTTRLTQNDDCADLTVQEVQARMAQAGYELRFIANLAAVLGLPDDDVQVIDDIADALITLSQGNVLQDETVRQIVLLLQQLELVLNDIDPNLQLPMTGPNGGLNVYGYMREIINFVKCSLGIANSLSWLTIHQIPQGMIIYAGQIIPQEAPIQQTLVLIGLMDPLSVTGTMDLVTQDAISQLQLANGLNPTGIIDTDTALLINNIIDSQGSIFVDGSLGGNGALVNDYFITGNGAIQADGTIMTMGAYSGTVQAMQIVLYIEGYDIPNINGLFDMSTCAALQQFQEDHDLEIADDENCTVSDETLRTLNDIIRENNYLGSGFQLTPEGYLEGIGELEGNFGPGVANYEVNTAEADGLREGDIVLMYTFLDEETLLIATDQIVIDEVIKRRALSEIFAE